MDVDYKIYKYIKKIERIKVDTTLLNSPKISYFQTKMASIVKPLDLIKLSIGERVYIKCRGGRELEGLLHAFDSHMNMVLEDVEETVTTTDIDEETEEELVQSRKRSIEMLFVRGDVVILVSPPLRVA